MFVPFGMGLEERLNNAGIKKKRELERKQKDICITDLDKRTKFSFLFINKCHMCILKA